jgi:hypothetical protein
MGLFDRLFGTNDKNKEPMPKLRFGRFSDSYKTDQKYAAWESALQKFDEKDYMGAYRAFLDYLRDDAEDNVHFREENGSLFFEIFQGSKKLVGCADGELLKVQAKIAKAEQPDLGFMYRLLTTNYQLHYCRLAFDDNDNIVILFDSYTADGSPYKLYHAFKELATNADKLDDLLIEEFDMLRPIDNGHIQPLDKAICEKKYDFICQKIQQTTADIDASKLDAQQYAGGFSYMLLGLVYKIDYLTRPEGHTTEVLERVHGIYFDANDGKNLQRKNLDIRKELSALLKRPKEVFFKEMYEVVSTFGITTPVAHERLVDLLDNELKNMDWYLDNGHEAVALAINDYIVGYCLFNWAPPQPDRELLHLYYEILEADYFKSLGIPNNFYNCTKATFNEKAIKREVRAVCKANEKKYPGLKADTSILDYRSKPHFAKSFLLMLQRLDLAQR